MFTRHTIVCRILLAAHQELRVEQLAVLASANLINWLFSASAQISSYVCLRWRGSEGTYGRIEVDEDRARDIFAAARLGEESLVRAALGKTGRVWVWLAVLLKAVLEQVQLPNSALTTPTEFVLSCKSYQAPVFKISFCTSNLAGWGMGC